MTLKTGNIVRWSPQFPNGWQTRGLNIGVTQDAAIEHSLQVTTGPVVWYWSEAPHLPVIYYRGREILPSKVIEWEELENELHRLRRYAPATIEGVAEAAVESVAAEVLIEAARKKLDAFLAELQTTLQSPSTSSASTPAPADPADTIPP